MFQPKELGGCPERLEELRKRGNVDLSRIFENWKDLSKPLQLKQP